MLLVAGEDDLLNVTSAVADLAGRWKGLGISLGICLSDLNAILFPSPDDCLREMLALWLKQNYNVNTIFVCTASYYTNECMDHSHKTKPLVMQLKDGHNDKIKKSYQVISFNSLVEKTLQKKFCLE